MKRLLMLAMLMWTGVATAQTYLFTQPSGTGFPEWRCSDHAAHYAMYVIPPTGYLDLYGERGLYWTENHKHCRWKVSDGSHGAIMQFSFAKALEASYIDMWSDLSELLGRDCLDHNQEYAPLISNQLMILTIADDGETWVGAYAGDLVTTLNDGFTPLSVHEHYIEVGLIQRVSNPKLVPPKVISVLPDWLTDAVDDGASSNIVPLVSWVVPGDYPQGATSRLEVYIYQQGKEWRAGGWYNDIHFDAPLIAKPAVLGKVGIIPVIMPHHLCTLNPAAREFTFNWLEAQ